MWIKVGTKTCKITDIKDNEEDDYYTVTVSPSFGSSIAQGTEYNVYSDYMKSKYSYFKARSTPEVSITNIPQNFLNSRIYTFDGKYEQDQNILWKSYRWILYDSKYNIVDDTGEISTGEIEYTYDGFLSGEIYYIKLSVIDTDDIVTKTELQQFNVKYASPVLEIVPTVTTDCEHNAMTVEWESPFLNVGVITNTIAGSTKPYYEYIKDDPYLGASAVWLHEGTKLTYEPSNSVEYIPIQYESTISTHCRLSDGFSGDLIYLKDKNTNEYYKVSYNNGSFFWDINGEIQGKKVIFSNRKRWLLDSIENYNQDLDYSWDDSQLWNDVLYYSEQSASLLSEYWFKINLLPTTVVITYEKIKYENIFLPPNSKVIYTTKLYNNYKLRDNDLLYE